MKVFVTGCGGFIGSNLVDRLLRDGNIVIGFDNFSTGSERFLSQASSNSRFLLIRGDLLADTSLLAESVRGCDVVFHLAANADVRFGAQHPRKDLEQNTIATFNVLEAMRVTNVRHIIFASTGSVYGEACTFPTPENAAFPLQTSLYGASKLAGEGLIAAYCEGFNFQSWIFRFVSILGERYTHGHVFDFYRQLKGDPTKLTVLGNGKQRKSYLFVQDCIDAMLLALRRSNDRVNIFNLGANDYCTVDNSIGWICQTLSVNPTLNYTGGDRGWVGDNPFIFLDTTKIRSVGWMPTVSIAEAVVKTVKFLRANEWVLDTRRVNCQ